MGYKSVDEINTISLKDALITEIHLTGEKDCLEFVVRGAVVRDNNSQNDCYTDKYSDDMTVRFQKPVIEAVLLEGHKYYDANDRLVEEVPDKPVKETDYEKTLKSFKDKYIFYGGTPDGDKKRYQMIIDFDDDSYVLSFTYERVTAFWERFLNKANLG